MCEENDVSIIVIELFGIKVSNVYKPPSKTWPDTVLCREAHPAMYVGDFNSHHSLWGYARNNDDGNKLVDWAESLNLFLIHDFKDLSQRSSRVDGNEDTIPICVLLLEISMTNH